MKDAVGWPGEASGAAGDDDRRRTARELAAGEVVDVGEEDRGSGAKNRGLGKLGEDSDGVMRKGRRQSEARGSSPELGKKTAPRARSCAINGID